MGKYSADQVQNAGLYRHFVDVVWFLFLCFITSGKEIICG
jgi:heme/copper-type cytochrome/quinol oxidase subunit 3